MKKIEAFKCELTGALYEDEKAAAKSEFMAMMKRVGGSLPAMGSVNSASIMEWLARSIESEVYPTVIDKIQEALDHYQKNVRRNRNFITIDRMVTLAEAEELRRLHSEGGPATITQSTESSAAPPQSEDAA